MSKLILDYYKKHAISTEHGVDAEWDKHFELNVTKVNMIFKVERMLLKWE